MDVKTTSVQVFDAYSEGLSGEIEEEGAAPVASAVGATKAKKQFNAGERSRITAVILHLNKSEVQQVIIAKISSSLHITAIPERAALWQYCTGPGKAELCRFIDELVGKYTQLYQTYAKGANKYTRFYLAWYGLADRYCSYATTLESKSWWETFRGSSAVTDDTRNTLVTTLLHVTFNVLQHKAAGAIEGMSNPAPSQGQVEEDEVSLLRLGGWALFSAKSYRERALKKKSRINHTAGTLKQYSAELKVLEYLVMTDKSDLPVGITAQDRGGMTFPHPSLLPYIQSANQMFKELLNLESYRRYGKHLMEVITVKGLLYQRRSDIRR